ncbi:hypothetical protein BGX26_009225 [Mortierella sp. AD094]|nr:hypothetical protein BGX26_009225 [Mortierella sp. AD094]
MNSDLRARLLELGFSLGQARAANNGKASTSQASSVGTNKARDTATLHLRDEQDDAFESDLQKALEESSRSQPVPTVQCAEPSDTSSDSTSTKKIKINIIRNQTSDQDTPLLPLTSRHKEEEMQAMNATKVAEAARRAEKLKKEKMEARLARQRALEDLKQDRENRKLRGHPKTESSPSIPSASTASSASGTTSMATGVPLANNSTPASVATKGSHAMVQTPIPAPQPIVPNSRLPADVEMEEPPSEQNHEPDENEDEGDNGVEDQAQDEDNAAEDINEDGEDEDEGEGGTEDEEDEEDEDDGMMHAMPMPFHPPQNPFAGPGRIRMPFSGAGHSLGSGSASTTGSQPETPADSSTDADALRRQRILDAMANRTGNQTGQDTKNMETRLKKTKERTIPTLQSLCCYEVAVMLTAKDAKSSKNLKLLGENIGSQAAEGIVQELVKLKQLDQLTFKRLYRCSLVNVVLDAYSRSTDSLMDAIGASQSRSLTYLSLKECTFLTDKGFSNIGRFEELEFLDLSHCRVTDKTLEFTLNLQNLNTLHLSATKVTTNGLAKVISEASWKSTLQTLDVSYCAGISGPFVLINLQELVNIRSLKLNNTLAFDQSPVRVPDHRAFTRLENLDLARTPITDDDLVSLIPSFKAVEAINLNSCIHITALALERCANGTDFRLIPNLASPSLNGFSSYPIFNSLEIKGIKNIGFPNREHDLLTVLPVAAALPLTHLDLTGFLYVGDEAILSLSAAVNLQLLSLAGTKLTDIGAAVFVHMSSLKELLLDRTCIGDKTMEYLRDLGRLEVLSLQRCERLTTVGMARLGKCAFFSVKLKRLNLGYNKYIHDEALAVFTRCHGLNTLNLEYTDVSQERALRLQGSLPALKQLRIQGVTNGAVYEENPRPTFT